MVGDLAPASQSHAATVFQCTVLIGLSVSFIVG